MGSAGRWGIVCVTTTVLWASWSLSQRGDRGPKLPDLNVNAAKITPTMPALPPDRLGQPDRPGPYESRLTSLPAGPEEPTMLQPSLTNVPRPPRDGSWHDPTIGYPTDGPAPLTGPATDEVPVDLHQPTLPPR